MSVTDAANERADQISELTNRKPLPSRLAEALRERLIRREWSNGERLPSEAELASTYRVSRATVRQALKSLESQGLVITHRGRGTFATNDGVIRAGMQDLESITATIAAMGMAPSMVYHHRTIRAATDDEKQMFDLTTGTGVLDIQRRVLADGVTVAYVYDVLPLWVFPVDFRPKDLKGSVFAFLAAHGGPVPARALAKVHAVSDAAVAWDGDVPPGQLYVLLDQLQYDDRGRPFMYTKSYFVEGRFTFTVVRRAPGF